MLLLLPAILAISFARSGSNRSWWTRLAVFDGALAVAVLVAGGPERRDWMISGAWLIAEASWACWRSLREPRAPRRRGGGWWSAALALVLSGGVLREMGAIRGSTASGGAAAAAMVAGLIGSMAETTSHGRLCALLVADGGLLLADWGWSGAGSWGSVPILLVRGILIGMLEREAVRRRAEGEGPR